MKARHRVPVALRLAVRLLPSEVRTEVLGDLLEERASRQARLSGGRLLLWDLRQAGAAFRWRLFGPYRRDNARSVREIRTGRAGRPVLWLDVKLAFRMMRRQPLLTVVAGLTLALGIPSSVFPAHLMGILDGTFPVEDGHRILGLRNWNQETGRAAPGGIHEFSVWRETLQSFQSVGAARIGSWNVHSPDGRAEEVRGAQVSPAVFDMMRIPPLMGRGLLEADERTGATDVVVISHALWTSRFGRDTDVVGKSVDFGRKPHTVVGVMPEGFLFPRNEFFWLPLRPDLDAYPVGEGPGHQIYGRLADGVTVAAAQAELETVGARLASEWPATHSRLRPEVVTIGRLIMHAPARGWVGEVFVVQLLCLGLLLVACGNVGTLILARTAMREGEMSVRTALGASRSRILSQLFLELFVLAAVATGLGLIAGDRITGFAFSLVLSSVPYWFDPSVGLRTWTLAMGLAAVCAVGAGVVPAWKATRPGVQHNLKLKAAGSSLRFGLMPTLLIVAEVTLSVGFLCLGAAAFAGSRATDPAAEMGLDLDRHIAMSWRPPDYASWGSGSETVAPEQPPTPSPSLHDELQRRLLADPGSRRVAMAMDLPGTPFPPSRRVEVEGRVTARGEEAPRAVVSRVHFAFFQDLGRPVLAGRGFTSADVESEPGGSLAATLVNTQFVEQILGGVEAVGRRIRYQDARGEEQGRWFQIVGVVGDLAANPHDPGRGAAVYHPLAATDGLPMGYFIEVQGDPEAFIPRARQLAAEVDGDAVVGNLRIVSDVVDEVRLEMTLRSVFTLLLSLVGALLAATGLHALMSFTVSQRTREIGIRAALGAGSANIVSTIARRAAIQLLCGVIFGVPFGYWIVTETLNGSYRPLSSPIGLVAGVAGSVVLVGALACLAPTLRGLRIQPTEALRSEG